MTGSHVCTCFQPAGQVRQQRTPNTFLQHAQRPSVFRRHSAHRPIGRSCRHVTKAAVDESTLLAVTQQAIAFAVVVAGEGVFTWTQLPAGAKGRPNLFVAIAAILGIVAAAYLLQTGTEQQQAGLSVGFATSLLLFITYIRRTLRTEGDPKEWPGPKVWPGTMILLSFFAVGIFSSALLKSLSA